MDKKTIPDFSGKCISLALIDEGYHHDLNDPRFEIQCGKLFIVGTIPADATDSEWSAGHTGAVAWDRVRSYVLFENLEIYKQAVQLSEKYDKSEKTENT